MTDNLKRAVEIAKVNAGGKEKWFTAFTHRQRLDMIRDALTELRLAR